MTRKDENESNCAAKGMKTSCCQVESIISVDDRGQTVLPKEVRARAGIQSGDKLALISWVRDGKICCISLVKAEDLAELARSVLGPMIKELTPN